MTSRERIIETLNHREPDVLAIDFGGMRSTGIHAIGYRKLTEYLKMGLPPARLYDVFQQLAEPQMEVVDRLGGDVVQAHQRCPAFGIAIDEGWKQIELQEGVKVLAPSGYSPVYEADGSAYIYSGGVKFAKKPSASLYFDQIVHPYQGCQSEDDIDKVPVAPWTEADIAFIEAECRDLYQHTDKAILVPFGGNIFEAGQLDFGYEEFFVNLLLEPDMMHYYFSRLTNMYMENLKSLMPRIAPYCQVLQFGDDLGTQEAPQISLETYRQMIKPYHARQYHWVQDHYPSVKVFLHSCGAIAPLIPDLLDAGVQVLNPIQISAKGMNPAMLKKEYGNSLSFWGGGANTSRTVTFGTPGEIKKESEALIEIFSKGGGYVFNQVHNFQPNVPPENIMAVYDTALNFRRRQRGE
jgi:uroporphyrinogen decarboxylase